MIQNGGLSFESSVTEEAIWFVLIQRGGTWNTDRLVFYILDIIGKVNLFLQCAQEYGLCWQRLRRYDNLNASKFHYVFLEAEHVPPRANDEGTLLTMLKMLQLAL